MRIVKSLLPLVALALAAACASTAERTTSEPADLPDNVSRRAEAPAPAGEDFPPAGETAAETTSSSPAATAVEPRSEWKIDGSIPTPEELREREILAKFRHDDGSVIIIYRRPNGDVYRRKTGTLGAFIRVEEQKIELEP